MARSKKTASSKATPPPKTGNLATDAPGAALGFYVQQTRLVHRLLEAQAGESVCLEHLDDVAVMHRDGTITVEQTKSSKGYNPVADAAVALWKTIANWVRACKKGYIDPARTKFVLYVSPSSDTTTPGYLVKALGSARDKKAATKALEQAREHFWGAPPRHLKRRKVSKSLSPHLVDVFSTAEFSIAVTVVGRLQIVIGSGDPISEVRSLLEKELISESMRETVLEWSLGWAKKVTDGLLREDRPAVVSYNDFRSALLTYVRHHDRDKIFGVIPHPSREEVSTERDNYPVYLRQLALIESDEDDLLEAASDYLRAAAERTTWADRGYIDEHDLEEFVSELIVAWRRKKKRTDIAHRTDRDEVRGKMLYLDCMEHKNPIGGRDCPDHFTRGSFHGIANVLKIGWHPDYEALLKDKRERREHGEKCTA